MNISISVAATPCAMPQIMFAGDLEARCALLAGLGYDGIDMFFPDPQCTDARAAKAALDRNGLRATMLAAQGDLMADGLYLNDAGRLPELLERSKYHLEQCAVLGAMPNIGFIRGWHRNDQNSLPRMADGLAAYCQLAASFGVDVLLEPICRYEIDSIHTTDQAIDLCERAGKPANLGLLLDLFHMNIEEDSMIEAILLAGDKLGHFHVGENNRRVPGKGGFPWYEIGLALRAIGYQKNVVMEPFVMSGGGVGSDIKVWRDLSNGATTEQLDEDARRSVEYLRYVFEGPNSDYRSVLRK